MKNTLFPIFIKTEHFNFMIVGGGNVGLEKTNTLLKQNPNISLKIVAEKFHDELIKVLDKFPHIKWEEKSFDDGDLENIDVVIIATDNPLVNKEIREKAKLKRVWVNAADQPDLCDFYLGSIVNKGNLKIAISTNGKSPVLARRMREHFEEIIPDKIEETIQFLNQFRASHKGSFQEKLEDLNEITKSLVENKKIKKKPFYKSLVFQISFIFLALFIGYGISVLFPIYNLKESIKEIPFEFYAMVAVGFFAQIIDGAVGLGYGVTCSTSMMLFGIKLPAISGSIHTAEMFSSGISGYSHYKFGNVNKKLLVWLAVPGVIGAIIGASLLSYVGSRFENITYGVLSIYTFIIGIALIRIALKKKLRKKKIKYTGWLALAGGFLDAFGGGGWGAIVTSTLLSSGRKSKYVIGTVSLSEFFVTLAASIVFFTFLGISHWFIVLGLIFGGLMAAPIAVRLAGKMNQRLAISLVALLVIIFSVRMFFKLI